MIRKGINYLSYSLYNSYYRLAKARVKKNKVVWLFCTPKSASSYLHLLVSNLLRNYKTNTWTPLPFGGDRYHEPSVIKLFHSNLLSLNRNTFSGHLHTQYSEFLSDNLLGERHKIICQTRSIYDTLVSLYEFYPTGRKLPFIKLKSDEWQSLSKVQRYDYLIQYYVPWHIDFIVNWKTQTEHSVLFIRYEDLIKDTSLHLDSIMSHYDISVPMVTINDTIEETLAYGKKKRNFNKGIAGRGKAELNQEQLDRIQDMIELRSGSGLTIEDFV